MKIQYHNKLTKSLAVSVLSIVNSQATHTSLIHNIEYYITIHEHINNNLQEGYNIYNRKWLETTHTILLIIQYKIYTLPNTHTKYSMIHLNKQLTKTKPPSLSLSLSPLGTTLASLALDIL